MMLKLWKNMAYLKNVSTNWYSYMAKYCCNILLLLLLVVVVVICSNSSSGSSSC